MSIEFKKHARNVYLEHLFQEEKQLEFCLCKNSEEDIKNALVCYLDISKAAADSCVAYMEAIPAQPEHKMLKIKAGLALDEVMMRRQHIESKCQKQLRNCFISGPQCNERAEQNTPIRRDSSNTFITIDQVGDLGTNESRPRANRTDSFRVEAVVSELPDNKRTDLKHGTTFQTESACSYDFDDF